MNCSTMCPLPFESLALKSWLNGQIYKVYPCCNMKHDKPITKLRDNILLDEIFFSDTFKKLRDDLKNGVKNTLCNYCWDLEDKTGHSPRLTALKNSKSNYTSQKDKYLKIKKLDLLTDENCNLRCRMCTPSSSNSLRIDVASIIDKKLSLLENWSSNSTYYTEQDPKGTKTFFNMSDTYAQEIIAMSDSLKEIKFTGGEPTISSTFWNIIDNINNPNIKLHLTTNGTKFNTKLLSAIDKFNEKHFTISIDGINETYNYVRHPFTWNKLQKNIQKLCETQHNKDTSIHFCSVLTSYNILNLHYLVQYIENLSNDFDCNIQWKCIPDPHPKNSAFDVKYLPKHILNTALNNMTQLHKTARISKNAINKCINYISYYINNPIEYDTKLSKQKLFVKELKNLDLVRNQRYSDYLHIDLINFISEFN